MMYSLIERFPQQLEEAIKIGEQALISNAGQNIRNIIISGMGGSGIGGRLVFDLIEKELKVPFVVNTSYFLPAFADDKTLVIISSYSGNTEETLNVMQQAIEKECHIKCITSGGKVMELAKQNNFDLIRVPGHMPPRACLGYSFVEQLYILLKSGFISENITGELKNSVQLLVSGQPEIKEKAKDIAEVLSDKILAVFCEDSIESVAIRFRQQVNENAKMLAWSSIFPELNHNELVGWRTNYDNLAIALLRHSGEFERNSKRIEISKQIMQEVCGTVLEITASGDTKTEQMMYLLHLTDWISYYIAVKRNVDAMEVNVIDHLKNELAKN